MIENSVAKARIQTITITYNVTTTTGTIKLYDNIRGDDAKEIFSVVLSSGDANPIHIKFDIGAYILAEYGLMAIHEGGTSKNPIVTVTYW